MQRFFALVLLAALSIVGLTGCGNKGPLYLPPEPVEEVPAEVEPPADAEAPAANEAPAADNQS